jgi:XRE family aerobic/anaerobic benzoate catabolism transcriptional regulator
VLRDLAARVRALREGRDLTRLELARRSGLSTRFLARIEGGDGNVSVVRLADLASALGVGLHDLVRPQRGRSPVVALVGLRGAGKSTVGPLLARRLGTPFLEMEALVREASGLPLDQLFELHGEAYYRRVEREILGRVLAQHSPTVLAAAGGVVNEPSTWDALLEGATVVWLRARPEDHWQRVVAQGDRRPMRDNPDAMAQLRAMLAAREHLYRRAHVIVESSGRTPAEVADAVEKELASWRPTP